MMYIRVSPKCVIPHVKNRGFSDEILFYSKIFTPNVLLFYANFFIQKIFTPNVLLFLRQFFYTKNFTFCYTNFLYTDTFLHHLYINFFTQFLYQFFTPFLTPFFTLIFYSIFSIFSWTWYTYSRLPGKVDFLIQYIESTGKV